MAVTVLILILPSLHTISYSVSFSLLHYIIVLRLDSLRSSTYTLLHPTVEGFAKHQSGHPRPWLSHDLVASLVPLDLETEAA